MINVVMESAKVVITAKRVTMILSHIKRSNIAYMLGVFMMHTAGATGEAVAYGTGLC